MNRPAVQREVAVPPAGRASPPSKGAGHAAQAVRDARRASAILAAGVTAASASSEHRRHHDGRHALRGVALTTSRSCSLRPSPRSARAPAAANSGDTALIGIDFRPRRRALGARQRGRPLRDRRPHPPWPRRVAASPCRSRVLRSASTSTPSADRLRIVSDTGQNLRHNVDATATRSRTAPDLPGPAVGARHRRRRRGLHQQRPRPDHGDDALRPGPDARPDRDPVAAEQRPLAATGKLGVDAAAPVGSTSTARSAVSRVDDAASPRSARPARRLYGIDLLPDADGLLGSRGAMPWSRSRIPTWAALTGLGRAGPAGAGARRRPG